MPLDKVLVRRKCALILDDLKDVERLSRVTRAAFLVGRDNQLIAERLLERIISRMIDINYHIVTQRDGVPPRDFYQSFTKLAELGVLSPPLANALAPAAGLRNRLAHEYNEIDQAKIYEALGDVLSQAPRFLEAVEAALGSEA
ncbi:MAG TPA: DUF86 domain-containing protein [Gemmatimonadales bacterium]|nr:DUF86 domain-containing protein [Gemmatimonadales bacterium]